MEPSLHKAWKNTSMITYSYGVQKPTNNEHPRLWTTPTVPTRIRRRLRRRPKKTGPVRLVRTFGSWTALYGWSGPRLTDIYCEAGVAAPLKESRCHVHIRRSSVGELARLGGKPK